MSRLLRLTAAIEAGTGVALLLAPAVVVQLLLSSRIETSAATALAHLGGAALLALDVACWLGRDDTHSRAARGLVAAMILYNLGAAIILGTIGISGQPAGIALWPAVVLHTTMTAWCGASLMGGKQAQPT